MKSTLTILAIIAFIILIGWAVIVSPPPTDEPPTATSTPITLTWDKTKINSETVRAIVMRKISDNPVQFEPIWESEWENSGSLEFENQMTEGGYVQIACPLNYDKECYASEVMGPY